MSFCKERMEKISSTAIFKLSKKDEKSLMKFGFCETKDRIEVEKNNYKFSFYARRNLFLLQEEKDTYRYYKLFNAIINGKEKVFIRIDSLQK